MTAAYKHHAGEAARMTRNELAALPEFERTDWQLSVRVATHHKGMVSVHPSTLLAVDRMLSKVAAQPTCGAGEPAGLGFMCRAFGETDVPVCAFARTPEEVGLFLCREWFGQSYAEMSNDDKDRHDGLLRLVRADKFDPEAWNGTDHISIEFEIGGIEITRCAFEPLATPRPSATQVRRQYRLLQRNVDVIEPNDEFLGEDGQTWVVDTNAIFVGMVYGGCVLRPARRPLFPGPQEGGAEA